MAGILAHPCVRARSLARMAWDGIFDRLLNVVNGTADGVAPVSSESQIGGNALGVKL